MEMKFIDAFGLQCPKPLVLAKKEIDAGCDELAVQVDNETAVKNLTRLGGKTGRAITVDEIEGGWLVTFGLPGTADATEAAPAPAATVDTLAAGAAGAPAGSGYAVFVNKDFVGDGDIELGRNLMKMAIYTLSESDDVPASMLFMNAGVKLVAGEEQQVIDNVKTLIEKGTEVLVCGTCLDYFGVKEQLAVGEVSNMYDILGRMQEASKVITL